MIKNSLFKKTFPLLLFIIFALFINKYNTFAANTQLHIQITPLVSCANGIREESEQCDGTDLGGQTCVSRGFVGGALSCNADCTFNTSNCTGGGGGGGGGGAPALETKVVIKGKAYPGSKVNILKDGKLDDIVKADTKADFKHESSGITPGIYTFGVWGEDKDNKRSITFTLTFQVNPNMITTVSGIFLPPTISTDKILVKKGETINILGQTAPKVEVDVHVLSSEIISTTMSDEIGAWLLPFNTESLEDGAHTTKARSKFNNQEQSGFGSLITFYVGEMTALSGDIRKQSDFNMDERINLTDFSIFLCWWKKSNQQFDLNKNGIVDLPDLSILLSYWTG